MKFFRKTLSDSSGFTLIEALVAIVVFSIGILAMSKMHLSASLGNHNAFELTASTMGASNEMESLLASRYSALSANTTHSKQYRTFTVNYTITQSSNSTELKNITVTVTRNNHPEIVNTYKLAIANLQP